ncbi:hypothetical protein Tco_1130368, partial [Tanacetum coccineum]
VNKGCLFRWIAAPNRGVWFAAQQPKGAFVSVDIGPTGAFGFAFNSQMGRLVRCTTIPEGVFGTAAPEWVFGFAVNSP